MDAPSTGSVRLCAIFAVLMAARLVHAQGGPDCSPFERQLDRDRLALMRQQQSIVEGTQELDEWTKANEDAQREALRAGIKLFVDAAARKLEHAAAAARTFDEFFRTHNVPLVLLSRTDARVKVERAYEAYRRASVAARGAGALKAGLLADDLWQSFKHEITLVAHIEADADAAVRQVVNDPDLRAYLRADDRGAVVLSDVLTSLISLGAQSTTAAKWFGPLVDPATSLASFIVDYGYDATKWYQSRQRILQQAQLSEMHLAAVAALKKQVERTVGKLQECRKRPADSQTTRRSPTTARPSATTALQTLGTTPTKRKIDGKCTTAAFDAAIQQQNALLARGDPLSVQAAGALSHGGRGPTYYVPILDACGPESGVTTKGGSASKSVSSGSKSIAVREKTTVQPRTAATVPVRASATSQANLSAPASTGRASATTKPVTHAATAATPARDAIAGTWIVEAGTANLSGTVNGHHLARQIPRIESRVTIARIGEGAYQWTETGMAQSVRTTIRRQSAASYTGPLSTVGAPVLPGVVMHGTLSFQLRGDMLVGDTREAATGPGGSIQVRSAWRARRIH